MTAQEVGFPSHVLPSYLPRLHVPSGTLLIGVAQLPPMHVLPVHTWNAPSRYMRQRESTHAVWNRLGDGHAHAGEAL